MESLVKAILNQHLHRDASDVIQNLGEASRRFSGKRILLTGAAGFLGSQFMHYFAALNDDGRLQKSCRVIALDNFMRGLPDWLSHFKKRSDFQVMSKDIIRPGKLPAADFIIHAASIASPIYYRKHPIETMDANVIGLRNLLEHAIAQPVEGGDDRRELRGEPHGFAMISRAVVAGEVRVQRAQRAGRGPQGIHHLRLGGQRL